MDRKPKVVLALGHPSHELRLYGWLALSRPQVCILTDGSGRASGPRLPRSLRCVTGAGASMGPICGAVSDLQVYAALLSGETRVFADIATELAAFLVADDIEAIVGDAAEGHNCTHDIWRDMLNLAVVKASKKTGRTIRNYEFSLFARPDECPMAPEAATWTKLDDALFARKVDAVRTYNDKLAAEVDDLLGGALMRGTSRFSRPDLAAAAESAGIGLDAVRQFPELAKHIDVLTSGIEIDAFRNESFWPVTGGVERGCLPIGQPFYELYGAKLVEAGVYAQNIRLRDHMLPVAEEMWARLGETRSAQTACEAS